MMNYEPNGQLNAAGGGYGPPGGGGYGGPPGGFGGPPPGAPPGGFGPPPGGGGGAFGPPPGGGAFGPPPGAPPGGAFGAPPGGPYGAPPGAPPGGAFGGPPPGGAGKNSTLAVVSLVAGIVGLFCCGFLGPLVAIITGVMAKSEIKTKGLGGGGMATGGIALGIFGFIVHIILLILQVALGAFDAYMSNM